MLVPVAPCLVGFCWDEDARLAHGDQPTTEGLYICSIVLERSQVHWTHRLATSRPLDGGHYVKVRQVLHSLVVMDLGTIWLIRQTLLHAHFRPHFNETHGSRGVGPRFSRVLTNVTDTIVVLVAFVLEEAAVGPNSRATEEKRGSLIQQLSKLVRTAVPNCLCYDKACRSQADHNDEWNLLSCSCISKCRLMG